VIILKSRDLKMNNTSANKQISSGITGVVSAAVDITHVSAGPECSTGPAPTKLTVGQFQDLRDTHNLIKSKPGMFWCYTHLADLSFEKQSPDPRYCQECYKLLLREIEDMKSLGNHHKPWWIPKTANEKNVQAVEQLAPNMSTLNRQKTTVDKLDPPMPVRPIVHPGPKSMALPLDRIVKLAADGVGSKLIARQLNADGIKVSYKTIQRLLKKVKA
jgi:hypothetical protein